MKLLTLHWTLHPEKNRGAYLLEPDGTRRELTPEQAYQAFLDKKKPRSSWYDAEITRRLQGDAPRQSISQELDLDYIASGAIYFEPRHMQAGVLGSCGPRRKVDVDIAAWQRIKMHKPGTDSKDAEHHIQAVCAALLASDPRGPIWIYEEPDPHTRYAIYGDPAENVSSSSDFSGIAIANCTTQNMVALGLGRWSPEDFAVVCAALGFFYNEALLTIESNAVGMAILMALTGRIYIQPNQKDPLKLTEKCMYRRLYTERREEQTAIKTTRRLGLRMNKPTKQKIVTLLRVMMEHRTNFCRDRRFWTQCLGFIRDERGRLGNPAGDDLVISVGVALLTIPRALLFPPNVYRQAIENRAFFNQFLKNIDNDEFWEKEVAPRLVVEPAGD